MDISLELHCDQCGSANLSLPAGGEDSGAITCNDCGEDLGTFGGLRQELARQALTQSAEALRSKLDTLPPI